MNASNFPVRMDDDDDEPETPAPAPGKPDDAKQAPLGPMIQRKFLEQRKIMLWGEVSDRSCREVTEKFLYLEADAPGKEITFYLNSPGGSITAGMAILDTMRLVEPNIVTYCVGQAASMAAVLLACGAKGKRYALPHARVLIHQPSMSGLAGQASDIDIYAREILRMREILNGILADATGQDVERIARDVDRDYIMEAEQAVAYGMVDKIIAKREK